MDFSNSYIHIKCLFRRTISYKLCIQFYQCRMNWINSSMNLQSVFSLPLKTFRLFKFQDIVDALAERIKIYWVYLFHLQFHLLFLKRLRNLEIQIAQALLCIKFLWSRECLACYFDRNLYSYYRLTSCYEM